MCGIHRDVKEKRKRIVTKIGDGKKIVMPEFKDIVEDWAAKFPLLKRYTPSPSQPAPPSSA